MHESFSEETLLYFRGSRSLKLGVWINQTSEKAFECLSKQS